MADLTITMNAWQVAGLRAATAKFNAEQPEVDGVKPADITEQEYAQRVFGAALDSYALPVSKIFSGDFILRFTSDEYRGIVAAAQASPAVASYLTQVRESPTVNLRHELVTGGIAALVGAGLLTAERAAVILAPA